jgi:hypothetical protein
MWLHNMYSTGPAKGYGLEKCERIHMRQPKRIFTTGLLIGIAAFAVPAQASTLWSWNYSGAGITASGILTTLDSPDAQGGYLITAITGVRNAQTITALQPTGTWIPGNEPYAVDNLVFAGPGPQLTKAGFGFALADGAYSNPFYADFLPTPGYLEFYSMPDSDSSTELAVAFSATLVSTPEPATFALLLLSLPLCCMPGVLKRVKSSRLARMSSLLLFSFVKH